MSSGLKRSTYAGSVRPLKTGVISGNATEQTIFDNQSNRLNLEVLQCYIFIDTDATVANRYPFLYVRDRDDDYLLGVKGAAAPANVAYRYFFSPTFTTQFSQDQTFCCPLPKLILEPYEKLMAVVDNGVAGDVWSVKASVRLVKAMTNV